VATHLMEEAAQALDLDATNCRGWTALHCACVSPNDAGWGWGREEQKRCEGFGLLRRWDRVAAASCLTTGHGSDMDSPVILVLHL
jgi:hypothetical protein